MKKICFLIGIMVAMVLVGCEEKLDNDLWSDMGKMTKDGVLEYGVVDNATLDRLTTQSLICTAVTVDNYEKVDGENQWSVKGQYESDGVGTGMACSPIIIRNGKYIEEKYHRYPQSGVAHHGYYHALKAIGYLTGREVKTYITGNVSYDIPGRQITFASQYNAYIVGAKEGILHLGHLSSFTRLGANKEGTSLCLVRYKIEGPYDFGENEHVFASKEEAYDWLIPEFERLTGGSFDSKSMTYYNDTPFVITTDDLRQERDDSKKIW